VLLTGPAGAGKTTAARAWARQQDAPAAHLSLDGVRRFLVKGYANPEDGWTAAARAQHRVARGICAEAARRYLAAGCRCIVDDAIFPAWPGAGYEDWRTELGTAPHVVIVLLPSLAVLLERNARRQLRARLREETVRTIVAMMDGWRQGPFPVIDNSRLSPATTARSITRAVAGAVGDI
jgi:predicted kinase